MDEIFDHIDHNLDILFVGYNPSIRSGETGHHYANPTNRFWTILFESGLTPRKYAPTEDFKLVELHYGLTNIVSKPTVGAADITKEEYQKGRLELKEKIEHFQPKIVCFVGKGVYQEYSGVRQVDWGIQNRTLVKGTIDFVAPSSSGLVRMKKEEILDIYRELNRLKNSAVAQKVK
ncbi:MAG: mismatch-specific DNA-glycosylase [Bacillota bacterium]|uniref:mismatch-specific DNA-glycosylase n=1 Tax=Bacillus sp. RO2 TaxID=2723913 RepID=UPI00145E4A65|nr:mismatch-specific DNA-glycosylase [Bacillus sp. RO2]MEA3321783.1 mismatch-specific DNA-glycosylase [Bacillota bacterium]NMH73186.1 mismatch-specific DNA-glycosylase [Bacillus sp. RO2]